MSNTPPTKLTNRQTRALYNYLKTKKHFAEKCAYPDGEEPTILSPKEAAAQDPEYPKD